MAPNFYGVWGLLGIIFFFLLCLIIWCQVLNQPKCVLVLFRRIIMRGCCHALSFIFQDGLWDQWKIWQILLLKCATEHLRWAYYFVTVTTRWSLKEQFCDKLSSTQGINSFWKGHPWRNRQPREPPDFSSMSVCFDSFSCLVFYFLFDYWCYNPSDAAPHPRFYAFEPFHSSTQSTTGWGERMRRIKHGSLGRRSLVVPLSHGLWSIILIAALPPGFSPVSSFLLLPLVSHSFYKQKSY